MQVLNTSEANEAVTDKLCEIFNVEEIYLLYILIGGRTKAPDIDDVLDLLAREEKDIEPISSVNVLERELLDKHNYPWLEQLKYICQSKFKLKQCEFDILFFEYKEIVYCFKTKDFNTIKPYFISLHESAGKNDNEFHLHHSTHSICTCKLLVIPNDVVLVTYGQCGLCLG